MEGLSQQLIGLISTKFLTDFYLCMLFPLPGMPFLTLSFRGTWLLFKACGLDSWYLPAQFLVSYHRRRLYFLSRLNGNGMEKVCWVYFLEKFLRDSINFALSPFLSVT